MQRSAAEFTLNVTAAVGTLAAILTDVRSLDDSLMNHGRPGTRDLK